MDQADISRLEACESFDDCQISTLQRYVAALGGQLELVAAFGDKKIILSGVSAARDNEPPAKETSQRSDRRKPSPRHASRVTRR
jgi:hypothetical protein